MIFLSLFDLRRASKQNCIYKLSKHDKVLSSSITKMGRTWTFLNHFRGTNEQ